MPRRKRSKKWLWVVVFLVLIGAAVAVGYLVWDAYLREKPTPASEGAETAKTEPGKTIEDQSATEKTKDKDAVADKKEEDYIEERNYSGLTGTVNYAGVNNGKLMIRTSIDQYVSDGTCELVLSRGGSTIYAEMAKIVADVATATCEGFDVATTGLGNGEAGIVINLVAGDLKGKIEGKVEL